MQTFDKEIKATKTNLKQSISLQIKSRCPTALNSSRRCSRSTFSVRTTSIKDATRMAISRSSSCRTRQIKSSTSWGLCLSTVRFCSGENCQSVNFYVCPFAVTDVVKCKKFAVKGSIPPTVRPSDRPSVRPFNDKPAL